MARPRTPIGTFGEITVKKFGASFIARTHMRDWDGKLRRLEASAATRSAAATLLKERISV